VYKTRENLQEPTSAEQQAAYADLLSGRIECFDRGGYSGHLPQSRAHQERRCCVLEVAHTQYPRLDRSRSRQYWILHRRSLGGTFRCRFGFPGLKRTRDLSRGHHFSPETSGSKVRCVSYMETAMAYGEWSLCIGNYFELIIEGECGSATAECDVG